jgi:hypothetical protein
MKIIVYICLILVLFAACSKEPNNDNQQASPPDYCVPDEMRPEIPPFQGASTGFGYEIKSLDTFSFGYVFLNPTNENEIIYYKSNIKSPETKGYYLYNMLTKTNQQVMKISPIVNRILAASPLNWSKKNWLIFAGYDRNIYKMQPNGDSLTQLTFTQNDFTPEWNHDGTKFITFHNGLDGKAYNLVRDENGNITDTLSQTGSYALSGPTSWQHPNYIIGQNDNGVFMYDYTTKKSIELLDKEGRKGIGNLRWINEVECIHSGSAGIFIFNTLTKQNRQIRKTTNVNIYSNVYILSNKQMIASRSYRELLPNEILQTLGERSSICILNPCDTVITEINLRQ